jgi:uncharacterized protein YpmS
MKEKEKLRAQIQTLRDKLNEIEETEEKAERKKHIGKCYKVEDNYQGTEKWFLYTKIVDESVMLQFSIDSNGTVEVRHRDLSFGFLNRYEEIPSKELEAAWIEVVKRVANMSPNLEEK